MKANLNSVYWELWELLPEKQRVQICGEYFDIHRNCVKLWDKETLLIEITTLLEILVKCNKNTLQKSMQIIINMLNKEYE